MTDKDDLQKAQTHIDDFYRELAEIRQAHEDELIRLEEQRSEQIQAINQQAEARSIGRLALILDTLRTNPPLTVRANLLGELRELLAKIDQTEDTQ